MGKRKREKNQQAKSNLSRFGPILLIGILALGFFMLGIYRSSRFDRQPDQIDAFLETDLEIGERVYQAHCAACHGVDLEGEPEWKSPNPDGSFRAPPHDESGHTWHHSDRYLLERIQTGVATLDPATQRLSNMPAYGDQLSDEEIEAVLTFIKASWPPDIQEIQAERTAADPLQ